jgi:F-type H+-transporting ATPase subunit delta
VIKRSIARRYAQALIELVEGDPGIVADRLQEFDGVLQANPVLKEVLISPAFRLEERKRVFEQLIKKLGWTRPLDRFLWYLVEHRRMAWLSVIAECFVAMVDERQGRIRVQVMSARPLDKKTTAQLKKALTEGLEGKVVLERVVDESLLAGITVRVGDLVIDGSLKTQMDKLRDILTHRSV